MYYSSLMVGWLFWVAVLVAFYVFVVRPWHMTLGCTAEEAQGALPGDELVPRPDLQSTHAITIHASPAEVWPWLIQMGQGRAGFYSYDWLEQLFGCEIYNVYEIVPALQSLQVGDGISLHIKAPPLTVFDIQPHRSIVLAGGPSLQPDMAEDRSWYRFNSYTGYSWTFTLIERPDGTTRFLARIRVAWNRDLIGHVFRSRIFLEPVHTIMQVKMNAGLKACAERR